MLPGMTHQLHCVAPIALWASSGSADFKKNHVNFPSPRMLCYIRVFGRAVVECCI